MEWPNAYQPTLPEAALLKVFISYSREDETFAKELADGLELVGGFEIMIDTEAIHEGENWKARLGAIIATADTVVFVLSPTSARSPVCAWEVEEAERLSKRILPVLAIPLEGIDPPKQLSARHYVRFDPFDDGKPRSFVDGLATLRTALVTDIGWLREQTRLLVRAREWVAGNRAVNRLLSGRDIERAKEWLHNRPQDAPEPTELHYEFISESGKAEEARVQAERRRAETLQTALDQAEAAQKSAEAARRLEAAASKRVIQRTIVGLIVALILTAGAGGAGWFAYVKQKEAEAQAKIAVSRQLAAQAVNHLADRRDLSLLLSLEAYRNHDTLEAQASLLAGLQHDNHLINFLNSKNRRFHSGHIRRLAFSETGKILVSASITGKIRSWDITTNQPLRTWAIKHEGGQGPIRIALSPNGKFVASAGLDGTIHIWEAKEGRKTDFSIRIKHKRTQAIGLDISADGKLLAVGNAGEISIWNTDTRHQVGAGLLLPNVGGRPRQIYRLAFDTNSRKLAVAAGKSIFIIDVDSQTLIGKPLVGHKFSVYALAFTSGDNSLISSGEDGHVIIWDLTTYERFGPPLTKPLSGRQRIRSLAISSDGNKLAIASNKLLWDFRSQKLQTSFNGYHSEVTAVAFSPNTKILATGSFDGTIMLWDVDGHQSIGQRPKMIGSRRSQFTISANGELVAIANGSEITLFDITRNREYGSLNTDGNVRAMSFDEEGAALAVFTSKGIVGYWNISEELEQINVSNLSDKKLWNQPKGGLLGSNLGKAAFSPDLRRLAVESASEIVIWSRATGDTKIVRLKDIGVRTVGSMSFDADGELLAIGSYGPIFLIDAATGERHGTPLFGHSYTARNMSFSPDKRTLVSTNDDGSVRFWNVMARQELGIPLRPANSSNALVFSPDGRLLALGGSDGSISLWDVSTGQSYGPSLSGPKDGIAALRFSSDRRTLVSISESGNLRIWDLDPTSWRRRACRMAGRSMSPREWCQYLGDTPYRKTCADVAAGNRTLPH